MLLYRTELSVLKGKRPAINSGGHARCVDLTLTQHVKININATKAHCLVVRVVHPH
jgi:hypothetical protein